MIISNNSLQAENSSSAGFYENVLDKQLKLILNAAEKLKTSNLILSSYEVTSLQNLLEDGGKKIADPILDLKTAFVLPTSLIISAFSVYPYAESAVQGAPFVPLPFDGAIVDQIKPYACASSSIFFNFSINFFFFTLYLILKNWKKVEKSDLLKTAVLAFIGAIPIIGLAWDVTNFANLLQLALFVAASLGSIAQVLMPAENTLAKIKNFHTPSFVLDIKKTHLSHLQHLIKCHLKKIANERSVNTGYLEDGELKNYLSFPNAANFLAAFYYLNLNNEVKEISPSKNYLRLAGSNMLKGVKFLLTNPLTLSVGVAVQMFGFNLDVSDTLFNHIPLESLQVALGVAFSMLYNYLTYLFTEGTIIGIFDKIIGFIDGTQISPVEFLQNPIFLGLSLPILFVYAYLSAGTTLKLNHDTMAKYFPKALPYFPKSAPFIAILTACNNFYVLPEILFWILGYSKEKRNTLENREKIEIKANKIMEAMKDLHDEKDPLSYLELLIAFLKLLNTTDCDFPNFQQTFVEIYLGKELIRKIIDTAINLNFAISQELRNYDPAGTQIWSNTFTGSLINTIDAVIKHAYPSNTPKELDIEAKLLPSNSTLLEIEEVREEITSKPSGVLSYAGSFFTNKTREITQCAGEFFDCMYGHEDDGKVEEINEGTPLNSLKNDAQRKTKKNDYSSTQYKFVRDQSRSNFSCQIS